MSKILLIDISKKRDLLYLISGEIFSHSRFQTQANFEANVNETIEETSKNFYEVFIKHVAVVCIIEDTDYENPGKRQILENYKSAAIELGIFFRAYISSDFEYHTNIKDNYIVNAAGWSPNQIANDIIENLKSSLLLKRATSKLVLTDENKNKITGFIEEVKLELKDKIEFENYSSYFFLMTSIVVLVMGLLIAILGFDLNEIYLSKKEPNPLLLSLKIFQRLLILTITGIISKILYKVYNEKQNYTYLLSNRLHSINYGNLYIKVFEGNIDRNEFENIFKNWSLNSTVDNHYNSNPFEDIELIKSSLNKLIEKFELTK